MKSLGNIIIKNKQRGKSFESVGKYVFQEFKRTSILYFSFRFSLLCSLLN